MENEQARKFLELDVLNKQSESWIIFYQINWSTCVCFCFVNSYDITKV